MTLFGAAEKRFWKPYDKLISHLITYRLPKAPTKWVFQPGWTRYTSDGPPEPVEYPLENALVYDIEKLYKISNRPTLATAASNKAWYGWVSSSLFEDNGTPNDMILLNPKNEKKAIVGFNVGYDRESVLDEYTYGETPQTAWIDLLAWYTASHAFQLPEKDQRVTEFMNFMNDFFVTKGNNSLKYPMRPAVPRQRSLAALYLRFKGDTLRKDVRDLFGGTSKDVIIDSFDTCMSYCASDVEATWSLIKLLRNRALMRIPKVNLIAQTHMLGSKVYVNTEKWNQFVLDNNKAVIECDETLKKSLYELMKNTKSSITSIAVSERLNILYKGERIVNSKEIKELVLESDPNTRFPSPYTHTYTLLKAPFSPLWEDQRLKPADELTSKIVYAHLFPQKWKSIYPELHHRVLLLEQTPRVSCTAPFVRPLKDETTHPHHPIWLETFPEGVIGNGYEKTFEYPEGYTTVSVPLEFEWIKNAWFDKPGVSKISPFLLKNAFEKFQTLYRSHMLVGAPELFEMKGIRSYTLITSFHKEVRYMVCEEDKEIAQNCLDMLDTSIKDSLRGKLGLTTESYNRLEGMLNLGSLSAFDDLFRSTGVYIPRGSYL